MCNVIFMVNLIESKKMGRTLPYKYSIDSWKHYADKYNLEIYVLKERIHDETYMKATWHKLYALELLNNDSIEYNRVLIVDCDTIVHPNAPNIFDIVTDDFNVVHNRGCYDWLFRSMEIYSKLLFNNYWFSFAEYFNSGFIVANKNHSNFFRIVLKFYHDNRDKIQMIENKYMVGTDQPVLNFMAQIHNIKLNILDYEWNMQDMVRKEILTQDLLFTKYGWVYHFNAIPSNYKLYNSLESPAHQWMKYTYQKLYK